MASVAPAMETPGMARTAGSARFMKSRKTSALGYLARGRATEAVTTPLGLNPGSTCESRRKLADAARFFSCGAGAAVLMQCVADANIRNSGNRKDPDKKPSG